MIKKVVIVGATSIALLGVQGMHPADASAHRVFSNCTQLNKTYKHGVGRSGAHDHVSGSTKPVTNFTRNTTVYRQNKARDRDKDGIACEKR
jgi:hypothetical protein